MGKIRPLWIGLTVVFILLVGSLVGMACGGDEQEVTASTPTTAPTEAPATDATEPAETRTESDEEKGKIVLVEQDWDGNLVTTSVAQILLEKEMGYEVELKFAPSDSAPLFIGLESGDFHFVCCNWPSFSAALLEEYVDTKGTVMRMGPSGVLGIGMGWYVPTYVIKGDPARGIEPMAPDLQSYEQLNQYKDLFRTADTRDKGRFLDFLPAWDSRNEERMEAFGLDFEVVYSGSEAASFAEIDASYQRGDPIFFGVWTPHWAHAKYDLTDIQLPPWTEECYPTGPEFNCHWPLDPVTKLAWPGLEGMFPDASQFLKNLSIDNDQQNEMVLNVTDGGMTPLEAAQAWVDANEEIWKAWIP